MNVWEYVLGLALIPCCGLRCGPSQVCKTLGSNEDWQERVTRANTPYEYSDADVQAQRGIRETWKRFGHKNPDERPKLLKGGIA